MPGQLACVLSYGLLCTPATIEVVEPPPPTPIDTATVPELPTLPTDPTPVPTPALGDATLVLARVQAFYDGTTDLKASFTQTYVHPVYATKKVSKGQLRARKPGLMVWDYADANNADYWVDDKRIYVVESSTKQVIRRDVGDSDIAGVEKFLFGGSQLIEDFRVKLANEKLTKLYGKPGHTAIRLEPKRSNPHYREIVLVVDDATGRVDAFVVRNQDNSTNEFELTGLTRNAGLSEADLRFKKPAGYKQIDG